MNWTLHCGDARDVLGTLPDASVNCVVSSPPYWGLRDYGTATWDGGDAACQHVGSVARTAPPGTAKQASNFGASSVRSGDCQCGARRIDQQIGLEPSPDAFVAEVVKVFQSVWRVLRDDGCVWLNCGDSYAGNSGGKQGATGDRADRTFTGTMRGSRGGGDLKPKDLVGVPWRVALALQADGWYLRSDVIWAKPNPMPESVTDRPTKAHEYVFLLTKSERYAYHADAIREPLTQAMLDHLRVGFNGEPTKDYDAAGVQSPMSVKRRIIEAKRELLNGANARTVWSIPTEASPYEHFAVMPKALARRCIVAGCPSGGTVLDPFAGVATTGVVALEEGRSFVGIELSPKYHAMARERLANVAPLLATEIPA